MEAGQAKRIACPTKSSRITQTAYYLRGGPFGRDRPELLCALEPFRHAQPPRGAHRTSLFHWDHL